MSDTGKSYGYDPFTAGSGTRWGRKGGDENVPEIANYEILDSLGAGGMGSVWSARYLPLNQIRAVKVLDKALALDPTFIERFSQEAKALGRLQHVGIVRVFDANADHNPPFIAMQWVEGKTLSEVLAKRQIPLDEALKYFEQIAAALDYAHSMGFVHRDIKPSNVMITDKGQAMLIDFGVANFLGKDSAGAGTVTGTTRYMAPEVIQGRMATSASDLWALSVLMYRVLTGKLPFDGKSSEEVFKKIAGEAPAAPAHVGAKLGKFLTEILQKDPSKRYRNATQMVAELTRAARPWVPKVKGEGLAVGLSMTVMGGIGLAVIVGIGALIYATVTAPKPKTIVKTEFVPVGGAKNGKNTPVPATGPTGESIAPLLDELRGGWFADMGTKFADVRFEPTGGRAFRLRIDNRNESGLQKTVAEGEVGEDGKTISFKQTEGGTGDFKGTVSEDRSRIAGNMAGEPMRLVRAADVAMTPFEESQLAFSSAIPAGWTSTTSEDGESRIVTFHPIGQPLVMLRVVVTPEKQGANLRDILAAREQTLAADQATGGDYKRINLNENAEFGGRNAVSWEFRHQKAGGPVVQGLIYALLRGDWSTLIESYTPVDDADLWTPILERIRRRTTFTG